MIIFLKILSYIGNVFIYMFLLRFLFNWVEAGNIFPQLVAIALIVLLPLITTTLSFSYLEKYYGKNYVN